MDAHALAPSCASLDGNPVESVTLNLNGKDRAFQIEPRVTLLDALREQAGLVGTKKGCDHGQCGACTVLIDGRRVLSCLSLAITHQGQKIRTIETGARRRTAPDAGRLPIT